MKTTPPAEYLLNRARAVCFGCAALLVCTTACLYGGWWAALTSAVLLGFVSCCLLCAAIGTAMAMTWAQERALSDPRWPIFTRSDQPDPAAKIEP